jgi:hypothetical protein
MIKKYFLATACIFTAVLIFQDQLMILSGKKEICIDGVKLNFGKNILLDMKKSQSIFSYKWGFLPVLDIENFKKSSVSLYDEKNRDIYFIFFNKENSLKNAQKECYLNDKCVYGESNIFGLDSIIVKIGHDDYLEIPSLRSVIVKNSITPNDFNGLKLSKCY